MRRQNAPQPDISFIRRGRERIIKATAVEGVPDLVIEILSPTNQDIDPRAGEKWKVYQNAAVPHYWIVDPAARVVLQHVFEGSGLREVARRQLGEELVSPLFPGITLPVADLFADLREED